MALRMVLAWELVMMSLGAMMIEEFHKDLKILQESDEWMDGQTDKLTEKETKSTSDKPCQTASDHS